MKTEIINGVCWIGIGTSGHYLSDEGFQELLKIEAVIDSTKATDQLKYLVFSQDSNLIHKENNSGQGESPNIYLCEWMRRALKFRQILAKIRDLSIGTLWVGHGHCLSTHWELALSTHCRIWFQGDSLVGFPELNHHRLPPGGSLDIQPFLNEQEREAHLKLPVMSVATADHFGLIAWTGGAHKSRDIVLKWMNQNQDIIATYQSKGLPSPYSSENYESVSWEQIEKIESRWHQQKKVKLLNNPLEEALNLFRYRKSFNNVREFQNLLLKTVGKSWLHPANQDYLSHNDHIIASASENDSERFPPPNTRYPIWIQVSNWSPPVHAVISLLQHGYKVIFYAGKSKDLADVLERIALKIEKWDHKKNLLPLWHQQACWAHVDSIHPELTRLEWQSVEILDISYRGQRFQFLNLESNFINSEPGYLETLAEDYQETSLPKELSRILNHLSKGLLQGRYVAEETPSSTWIRLMYLQELLELGQHYECELNLLLHSLQESGWGFLASESRWSYFLQTREGHYPESSDIVMPTKEIWDPGRWKHVIATFQNKNKKRKKEWHVTGISHHLALFAIALTDYLQFRGSFLSRKNLASLVSESSGFPKHLKSPDQFLSFYGHRRFELYRERYWPSLIPENLN